MVQGILIKIKLIISGHFNRYVRTSRNEFNNVHKRFGFRKRNEVKTDSRSCFVI